MGRILVRNLGKAYKQYSSRFGRLVEWISPVPITKHSLKWVLKDITFEVRPGEAVGIIGINGAGKSTLLKMITGTTQPTNGAIHMTGRVAALLELGMGFHPDFTGRQNVFMAGQVLGMTVQDISEKFTEIEEFAEIGAAIDMPVRVYSSGMQVRLAFSVATVIRPDILIVDEALSVGDAYFQHKCFDRIKNYKNEGTTLLFVSHDAIAIKNLCDRAILLNKGGIYFDGEPDNALDYYNAIIANTSSSCEIETKNLSSQNGVRSGSGEINILSVELFNESGPAYIYHSGCGMDIVVKVKIHKSVSDFCIGIALRDRLGNEIFGTNTALLELPLDSNTVKGVVAVNFKIPFLGIGAGTYSISVAVHDPVSHIHGNYDWWDKAALFEVTPPTNSEVVGLCFFPVSCAIAG